MQLRSNLAQITPSFTLVLKTRVEAKRRQGLNVVSFTVGEPDFPTPDYIKAAGIEAINTDFTRYTCGIGINELRQAIVEKLKVENGLDYQLENIAVSSGAKHSIATAIFALVQPGDQVLIPSPYWLSYPVMVNLAGAERKFIATGPDTDYKLTPAQLQQHIETGKSRVLLLNSPCNPTGSVYSREELAALVPIIKESGLWVISDEIYEKLLYDGEFVSLASFAEIKDQVIVINGVSKAFAMTGWRIGYAAARKEIIQAINKIQSHFTGNPCSISQWAAWKAIQGSLSGNGAEQLRKMQQVFAARRDLAYRLLSEVPGLECHCPQGAFYLFPRANAYYRQQYDGHKITGSQDLSEYLLEQCQVAVVPGSEFGSDNNFRISFATSESEISEGIRRIKNGLEQLKE